jgi:hypothetical protein
VPARLVARLALQVAVLLIFPGCVGRQYLPGGTPVAAHPPGLVGSSRPAPYPGEYALFRTGEAEPVVRRELFAGDPIGFGESGGLVAVAGAGVKEIPLPQGEYRWHVVRVHRWQQFCDAAGVADDAARPVVKALYWGALGVAVVIVGAIAVLVLVVWADSNIPRWH